MYDGGLQFARDLVCGRAWQTRRPALEYRSSMKVRGRWVGISCVLLAAVAAFPQKSELTAKRPKIFGLAHVAVYVDNIERSDAFYESTLGLTKESPTLFRVNPKQSVELEKAPTGVQDRIAHVAFETDSAEEMLSYLKARGVKVPDKVSDGRDGEKWFALTDPAGQGIEFIEVKPHFFEQAWVHPASRLIIHVGFVVRDRAAEEHFYKDILGFRPYWHGGMDPAKTEWVALQVPDGTFWIEEMLGASEHPDKQELGVLNHFSLGVKKIDSVLPALQRNGWKPVGDDQTKPQMGKDGKWQLNIYDPDATRVEFMEFRPAQKPCCSEFTGPHPQE